MKYYARYIPVKEAGKFIPDGAMFRSDYLPFHEFVMSDELRGSKLINGSEQQVELFLIAHYKEMVNPALGDTVYFNRYNMVSTIKKISGSDIILNNMPRKETIDREDLVKIVAKVSEKAVWVKAANEFSEKDVLFVVDVDKRIATIQCPTCNTYH
jgi:hypothetical protein